MEKDRVYNHDLLIHEKDRKWIVNAFPSLAWIAMDDNLIEKYCGNRQNSSLSARKGFDALANSEKLKARRLGITAILLGMVALIIAATEPLLSMGQSDNTQLTKILAGTAAILGVAGGMIGALGVLHGKSKTEWLRNRLLTERIRQSYFQFFVRRVREIAVAKTDDARKGLLAERENIWRKFERDYENSAVDWIDPIIDDERDEHLWIVGSRPTVSTTSTGDVAIRDASDLFEFYREQRFGQQLAYARHIQRTDSGLLSRAPKRQVQILSGLAFYCIFSLLTIHLVLAGASAIGVDKGDWGPVAHVLAVCLAIVALSAKTFEEGLRPERELERHRTYEWGILKILEKFDNAKTIADKINAMEEMESISYWELREFLKNHQDARFSI